MTKAIHFESTSAEAVTNQVNQWLSNHYQIAEVISSNMVGFIDASSTTRGRFIIYLIYKDI
jgi:hypothetical protein